MSVNTALDEDVTFDQKELKTMQSLYKMMGVVFLIFNLWFNLIGPIITACLLQKILDSNNNDLWVINNELARGIMQETLMLMMILVLIFVFQVSHKASVNESAQKQSNTTTQHKSEILTETPAIAREKSLESSPTPPSEEIFGS